MLDNVSQAEADRRARRSHNNKKISRTNRPQTTIGNNRTTTNVDDLIHTAGMVGKTDHVGFPWIVVLVFVVIAMLVGAFIYDRFHVSWEEQAINNYMNMRQVMLDSEEVENDYVSEDQDMKLGDETKATDEETALTGYLLPDSVEFQVDSI